MTYIQTILYILSIVLINYAIKILYGQCMRIVESIRMNEKSKKDMRLFTKYEG